MKMNLMPAFKYRFGESIRSITGFFAVMVLIFILFTAYFSGSAGAYGEFSLSCFGVAGAIALFVVGICTVREHLRLCLQMGVGRSTAFISEAVSAVLVCLALAVGGELLMTAAQTAAVGRGNVHIVDIYQLLYVGFEPDTLSFSQHIYGALVNAALFICGYAGGAFISLVFYRLPKVWKIVVAVGVPLLLMLVFPIAISESGLGDAFSTAVISVFNWMGESAVNWVLMFTGSAAVLAVLNWLLLRRAPITEAVN